MKRRMFLFVFAAVLLSLSPFEAAAQVAIDFEEAVINGRVITQSRRVTVAPGASMSGFIRVSVSHDFQDSTSVPVAATPNWWWGGFRSNADTFAELAAGIPAGRTTLEYRLPQGLSAPWSPGIYYIGVFAGVASDARQLMSCDMNPAGVYDWGTYPDGQTSAIDVSYWSSRLWDQAAAGNRVDGFRFCHLTDCYDHYGYGAAAVTVEVVEESVPSEIRLGPSADTMIRSSQWKSCGHGRKSERQSNDGTSVNLAVARGIHQFHGRYRDWKGSLIRFDLSGVPAGTELLEAKLYLFHQAGPREQVAVHRMNTDWVETEATWFEPADGADPWWSGWTDGQNYTLAPTDSQPVSAKGWVAWDVTADVSLFLGGTPNFGWFLKSAKTKGSDLVPVYFRSKEAKDEELRPYLILRFRSVDEVY